VQDPGDGDSVAGMFPFVYVTAHPQLGKKKSLQSSYTGSLVPNTGI